MVGACTEPRSGARTFSGRYALQSFEGEAVPLVVMTTPHTRWLRLVDTLYADGQGHFFHRHLIEVDSLVGSYRSVQESDVSGNYTISHDSVYFLNCRVVDSISLARAYTCDLPPLGILLPNGNVSLVPLYDQGGWSIYTPVR